MPLTLGDALRLGVSETRCGRDWRGSRRRSPCGAAARTCVKMALVSEIDALNILASAQGESAVAS